MEEPVLLTHWTPPAFIFKPACSPFCSGLQLPWRGAVSSEVPSVLLCDCALSGSSHGSFLFLPWQLLLRGPGEVSLRWGRALVLLGRAGCSILSAYGRPFPRKTPGCLSRSPVFGGKRTTACVLCPSLAACSDSSLVLSDNPCSPCSLSSVAPGVSAI